MSRDLSAVVERGTPEEARQAEAAPLRVGVSACLLGQEVRFDGQHKRDPFLVEQLGAFVEFVPVCPEVEVGMGIPRETLRLLRPAARADERDFLVPGDFWPRGH